MNESPRGTAADRVLPELPGSTLRAGFLCGGRGQAQMTSADPSRERPQAKGPSTVSLVTPVLPLSQGLP